MGRQSEAGPRTELRCAEWYGRHRRCVPAPPEEVFLHPGCLLPWAVSQHARPHSCMHAGGLQGCSNVASQQYAGAAVGSTGTQGTPCRTLVSRRMV